MESTRRPLSPASVCRIHHTPETQPPSSTARLPFIIAVNILFSHGLPNPQTKLYMSATPVNNVRHRLSIESVM